MAPKRITSAETAEHYRWGDCCDGWRLVDTASLTVIHERIPSGRSEIPHLHENARQFFFVLSGLASMRCGGECITVRAGQGIEIEPGVIHQMRNESDRTLEFLVISQPSTSGDRKPAE